MADELETSDVEEAAVGDFEFGDDREGHECEGHEGSLIAAAELVGTSFEPDMGLGHLGAREGGHETSHGKAEGMDLRAVGHADATLRVDKVVDGLDEGGVGGTDGDDVVAVVGDGGGDGTPLEAKALNEPYGGLCRRVAIENHYLEDVARGVGDRSTIDNKRGGMEDIGEKLLLLRNDDGEVLSPTGDPQLRFGDGVGCKLIGSEEGGLRVERDDAFVTVGENRLAADPGLKHLETSEVGDEDEIGRLARLKKAHGEAIVLDRSHTGGMEDVPKVVGAELVDGSGNELIDMTLEQLVGVDIVGAEHDHSEIVFVGEQGTELIEIARGTAFADEDFLAQCYALYGMGERIELVVGGDARLDVATSVVAGEARCMTVDDLASSKGVGDFEACLGVAGKETWIVHHLGETIELGAREKLLDVGRGDAGASGLEGVGTGHAGGDAEREMETHLAGALKHKVDALNAQDVGNLVRVGDDGNGALSDGETGKMLGKKERGLDVDVAVDKTRQEIGSLWRNGARGEGNDAAVGDLDTAIEEATIEDVDNMSLDGGHIF